MFAPHSSECPADLLSNIWLLPATIWPLNHCLMSLTSKVYTISLTPSRHKTSHMRALRESPSVSQKMCFVGIWSPPPLLPRYVWPPIPLWSKCSSFWVDMWASRLPYQCGRLRLDGGVGRGISRQSRSTPLFLLNNGFQKSNPSLCQKKTSSKRALYPIYYQDEVNHPFPLIPRPNLCEW